MKINSPLHDIKIPEHVGVCAPGLELTPVTQQMVEIKPFKQTHSAVDASLRDKFSLGLSAPCRSEIGAVVGIVWQGHNSWMLTCAPGKLDLLREVRQALAEHAAVVDQSHARCTLDLAGSEIRTIMSRVCALDLHPDYFKPGYCAMTQIGHINAHLLQLEQQSVYRIQVFRGFALSLWYEMIEAASDCGYTFNAT